jgi:hypothetical protein
VVLVEEEDEEEDVDEEEALGDDLASDDEAAPSRASTAQSTCMAGITLAVVSDGARVWWMLVVPGSAVGAVPVDASTPLSAEALAANLGSAAPADVTATDVQVADIVAARHLMYSAYQKPTASGFGWGGSSRHTAYLQAMPQTVPVVPTQAPLMGVHRSNPLSRSMMMLQEGRRQLLQAKHSIAAALQLPRDDDEPPEVATARSQLLESESLIKRLLPQYHELHQLMAGMQQRGEGEPWAMPRRAAWLGRNGIGKSTTIAFLVYTLLHDEAQYTTQTRDRHAELRILHGEVSSLRASLAPLLEAAQGDGQGRDAGLLADQNLEQVQHQCSRLAGRLLRWAYAWRHSLLPDVVERVYACEAGVDDDSDATEAAPAGGDGGPVPADDIRQADVGWPQFTAELARLCGQAEADEPTNAADEGVAEDDPSSEDGHTDVSDDGRAAAEADIDDDDDDEDASLQGVVRAGSLLLDIADRTLALDTNFSAVVRPVAAHGERQRGQQATGVVCTLPLEMQVLLGEEGTGSNPVVRIGEAGRATIDQCMQLPFVPTLFLHHV